MERMEERLQELLKEREKLYKKIELTPEQKEMKKRIKWLTNMISTYKSKINNKKH